MGVCNGKYLNERVGVEFAEISKHYAIRPKNL